MRALCIKFDVKDIALSYLQAGYRLGGAASGPSAEGGQSRLPGAQKCVPGTGHL